MAPPNIFMIFVLSQAVVIGIILVVLKMKLDRNLIDLAIRQLEAGQVSAENFRAGVLVVTHKRISPDNRERILKAFTKRIPGAGTPRFETDAKLLGGMIIKAGNHIVDFSLIDRLRKAR